MASFIKDVFGAITSLPNRSSTEIGVVSSIFILPEVISSKDGTLKTGDVLAAGPVLGKVRAMVDENGSRLKQAGPSFPVEALGFSEVPTAGAEFEVYQDEKNHSPSPDLGDL